MEAKLMFRRLFALQSTRRAYGTFTEVISEELATKSPSLVALHSRLLLPKEYKHSTLARCLTCSSSTNKYPDNKGMSIFGKNLLSYYTTEYLLAKYPRLPLPIVNAALDQYVGENSLQEIGYNWGIEEDKLSAKEKYLKSESLESEIGKLRFEKKVDVLEDGLFQYKKSANHKTQAQAMSSAVRSIVAGYYASTKDLSATRKFIYDYLLVPRRLKIDHLFQFEQPTRELSVLCKREGLQQPVARLLAETGRVSANPVFLVGVFSGEEKLGESFGASLKEAKIRASVNALKNWYLYSPLEVSYPSEEGFKSMLVDHGSVIV